MACPLSDSGLVFSTEVGPGYFCVNTQHLSRGHPKHCYKISATDSVPCSVLSALDFLVFKTSSLIFSALSLPLSLSHFWCLDVCCPQYFTLCRGIYPNALPAAADIRCREKVL